MKDLFRSLDEYPPELLLVIADVWGVGLLRDEPLHMVKRLGEAMLAPGALEGVLAGLTPAAREALAFVAANGGAQPARTLGMRYGELRRYGPARLRREQPWQAPAGPLEELFYRGLLYRIFGQLDESLNDLLVIPDQLLERLPPLAPSGLLDDLTPAVPRGEAVVAGDDLVEDLVAEIIRLRRQPVRQPPGLERSIEFLAHLDLGQRLRGRNDPVRLQMLWRLMVTQGLVEHDGRQWHPALAARPWLRRTDADQWLGCFVAWRDDRGWDELFDVPTVICDRDGWQNRAWEGRQRLCAIMAGLNDGWYGVGAFVAGLRRHHPDYLRADGDMDSWFIRDAGTGEYLRGMGAWDAVEGALAAHLVHGPLHWLGVVDLATDASGADLFRVSAPGRALVAGMAPALEEAAPATPTATVDEHMMVAITVRGSRYQRYQLERLAAWQDQDGDHARYWLSEDAVWQALNAGITGEQMLTFLENISGDRVPEIVRHTLSAWGARFGAATLRRVVLLETVDAATMQRIRQVPELARLLGASLGPARCLVDEEHMERLVAELKKRNIWPRVSRQI